MSIIDVHTHPVFLNRGRSRGEVDHLVSHARSLGIGHMVALGDVLRHGRSFTDAQIRACNDESATLQRWHPDFFTGFCYVNPTLGERAVMREIERCVTRHGFKGIKLEISNNARDACMRPVMEAARRWNLVVLQHTWSQTNIGQRSYHSDPADTALLARRNPDVPVIMAHLTGCGIRGVLEAKSIPNLHMDTSGGLPLDGLVEYAVEHLGIDRVLYGSDLPIRAPGVAIARIKGARLSTAEQQKVLHDNAARLLRLN